MPLRESRLQALMWMVFLAGLGAFIAGETVFAVLAVLAVAAIAFTATHTREARKSSSPSKEDLVSSN